MALPAAQATQRGVMNTVDSTLTGQGGTAIANMVIRLFSDYQDYLDPQDTPFSSSLGTGETVNQKKVEWLNRFLTPATATLSGNITNVATSIAVTAGDAWKIMPTDVLKCSNEFMWVSAVAADGVSLTVVRGLGSPATNAAHTAASEPLQIIAPASLENADSPIAHVTRGALEFNVPQLFDYAIQVSNREDNTPDYEYRNGNKYDGYLKQIMIEASLDFEYASILGWRATEGQSVSASTGSPTTMGGLNFFTDSDQPLAGAALTERNLLDAMQTLYNRVRTDKIPDTALAGPFMKRAVSSLWNASRYSDVTDEKTSLVWRQVDTDFGALKFVLSRYIPSGTLFFVNVKDIKKHPYSGGEWTEVLLPSSGPYKKGRFTGDYTIAFVNNAARHKISGASTTITDYAGM